MTRSVFAVLLAIGLVASGPIARTGAAPDDALAGRLGGTLASFEARYGAPISGSPEQGADFAVPGYGAVFVQFKLAPDPARPNRSAWKTTPESPAMVIALRSPRPAARPATVADPADWVLADAREQVRRFLPADAELGGVAVEGTSGTATCQSAALGRAYEGSPETCRIGFVLPTPDTVSFATLALAPAADGTGAGPGNPCAGLPVWARDAGARMAEAQGLLDRLAAVGEDDPAAPASLEEIGEAFARLAAEQRGTEAPPVAARAGDLLVDAFSGYAAAATAAADGVARGDATRVDEAVRLIGEADEAVARATALLRRALVGCGLYPGTPTAGA
jgi:hypothetical protein